MWQIAEQIRELNQKIDNLQERYDQTDQSLKEYKRKQKEEEQERKREQEGKQRARDRQNYYEREITKIANTKAEEEKEKRKQQEREERERKFKILELRQMREKRKKRTKKIPISKEEWRAADYGVYGHEIFFLKYIISVSANYPLLLLREQILTSSTVSMLCVFATNIWPTFTIEEKNTTVSWQIGNYAFNDINDKNKKTFKELLEKKTEGDNIYIPKIVKIKRIISNIFYTAIVGIALVKTASIRLIFWATMIAIVAIIYQYQTFPPEIPKQPHLNPVTIVIKQVKTQ